MLNLCVLPISYTQRVYNAKSPSRSRIHHSYSLQDQAIAVSLLFAKLIANRLFDGELKYFIYPVVLFCRAFDILGPH
jgi:hypothetical protein